jgi:hypothetical protein
MEPEKTVATNIFEDTLEPEKPVATNIIEDTSDRHCYAAKRRQNLFSIAHAASFNSIEPLGKDIKKV